jgi:hypothetical protein
MPTPTYTPLANVTLASATSSITLGSIPSTYRDLVISFTALGSATLAGRIRVNGDTAGNYHYVRMSGSGTTGTSGGANTITSGFISAIAQATTTGALQININLMDYSATNKHKIILSRAGQAGNGTEAFTVRWANTATAITSVTLFTSTGNWEIGTTVALYGIVS